ncbi:MAG: phosphotransferase family protein [SAR324 cluster bacterium]|nr:phosphotransferase family protein [SAR324 cluster bacterium]
MERVDNEDVELIPMRPDERIEADRVGRYLEAKLSWAAGTPEILQFQGGKANLTYLLRYPERECVLRRPPLGPVAPKSHDMAREYQVLSVLHRAYPLAPQAFLFNDDPGVVGAPFLIMERRTGIVIRREMPEQFTGQPELCRRMSEMIVDGLADLHAVDPEAVGLGSLGRPEGFVERQVTGWLGRWEAAKTEEIPLMEELATYLRERIPAPQSVTLVHNDYKLDNMMVERDDPAKPVAVFDWDMCTLGDPLVDLGTLLGYWTEAGDDEARTAFRTMPTHLPGFFSRAQLTERYARRSGRDMSDIRWYEVFALFKTAVVIQQIFVRWHRGQTKDERFRDYGARVKGLIEAARTALNR